MKVRRAAWIKGSNVERRSRQEPTKNDLSPFAKFFRNKVNENGLAPADIAYRLGVSDSTISRWLNGKTTPRSKNIKLLSQLLGVPERIIVENLVSEQNWINADSKVDPEIQALLRDFADLPGPVQKMAKDVLKSVYCLGLSMRNSSDPRIRHYRPKR